VQLALGVEDRAQLGKLIAALKSVIRPGERVGLPAILGVEEHARVHKVLADTLNAPVFEIPTLPPSVPGIRLYRTLAHRLAQLGVRIETNMEVTGFHAHDNAIQYIETATAARPLRHEAKHFLLATGGILGGGFVGGEDGIVHETVFGLPLSVPEGRDKWFRPRFFDEAGQPVFRGGVRVTPSFQPVDATGAVVYNNLWAAGGALAGADSLVEHSLEGVAIVTGIVAGRSISQHKAMAVSPQMV
jgi:glycerol-3-phosphate dehydrogenase subunit B